MKRKTSFFSHPDMKQLGIMAIGTRDIQLPPDCVVSITVLEGLGWWRFLLNGILSHLVAFQMKKDDGLLYAELGGLLGGSWGVTLSVWHAKRMVPFRDSGMHKTAMKKFRWLFGGKVQTYFLTFKANGRIPTALEALEIGRTYGRHYSGNALVRNASKPVWGFEEGISQ